MLEDKAKEPIKVLDRRHFTSDGERRPADPSQEQTSPVAPPAPEKPRPPAAPSQDKAAPAEEPGTPSIFSEFVLSLASSCFMSLGQIPSPVTGQGEVDLEGAGSMIDILQMLQVKTRGNLDPQERELLERTLFQLKMLYVQARKGAES